MKRSNRSLGKRSPLDTRLSEEVKAELARRCAGAETLAEIRDWLLSAHGLKTSVSSLSEYRRRRIAAAAAAAPLGEGEATPSKPANRSRGKRSPLDTKLPADTRAELLRRCDGNETLAAIREWLLSAHGVKVSIGSISDWRQRQPEAAPVVEMIEWPAEIAPLQPAIRARRPPAAKPWKSMFPGRERLYLWEAARAISGTQQDIIALVLSGKLKGVDISAKEVGEGSCTNVNRSNYWRLITADFERWLAERNGTELPPQDAKANA